MLCNCSATASVCAASRFQSRLPTQDIRYVASTSTKIYPRKSTSKIWRNWWGTKSTVWNHLRVRWAWEPAKAAARRMWRLWLPESLRRLSMQLRSWKLSLGTLSRFFGTLGNLLHLPDWFLAPTLVNPQLLWTYSWIGWWFGWSPPIIRPLSHLLAESFRWIRWLSSTEAFPGRPGKDGRRPPGCDDWGSWWRWWQSTHRVRSGTCFGARRQHLGMGIWRWILNTGHQKSRELWWDMVGSRWLDFVRLLMAVWWAKHAIVYTTFLWHPLAGS